MSQLPDDYILEEHKKQMQMFYSLEWVLKKYPTHKVSHKATYTDAKDLYLLLSVCTGKKWGNVRLYVFLSISPAVTPFCREPS